MLSKASATFAEQSIRQLSANSSTNIQTLLSQAPNVVAQPLSFQIENLRPFDVPV